MKQNSSKTLIDVCHLKKQFQECKGRVVLRGDVVKDDSSSCAIFTEQGSSASHMLAANVLNVMSRLPRCAGKASDAASAYTQVKMEDAPQLMRIPESECPAIWIGRTRSAARNSKPTGYHLKRNVYGHPLACLLWERQVEKRS